MITIDNFPYSSLMYACCNSSISSWYMDSPKRLVWYTGVLSSLDIRRIFDIVDDLYFQIHNNKIIFYFDDL